MTDFSHSTPLVDTPQYAKAMIPLRVEGSTPTDPTQDSLAQISVQAILDAASNPVSQTALDAQAAAVTATTQAGLSTAAASAASAAAASVGFLNAVVSTGGTPPYSVTGITAGSAGSGATVSGEFDLIVSGGPSGHAAKVTVSGGAITGYRITNGGLSTSNTAPTYTLPTIAGLNGATAPTATVAALANGKTFTSLSSDNQKIFLWQVASGVLAPVNDGSGTQVAYPLPAFVTSQISSIGVLDPDAWEDSGYAFFVINVVTRRVLIGVTNAIPAAAAINATGIQSGSVLFSSLDPDAWEDSAWDSFVIDLKRRVLMGQLKTPAASAATPDADALYDLVQFSDGTNNQTYSTSRATGKLVQLSPSGSNNVPVAIRPDGYAVYKSDRASGAPGGLYACPVAGGAEIPVMPLPRLVSPGDSLAAASYIAGSSYQAQAAAALGWQCDVFGINGQTARQIAARWGARPMYVTLASNTLLASGETAITTLTENPITGSVAAKIHGRLGLNGPLATLKRTGDGSDSQAYVMVQDAGGADTTIAAGTRFYPDSSSINNAAFQTYRYDSIMMISASRNSYTAADEMIASIAQMVATQKALSNRFLIALCLPGCDPNNPTSPLDGYGTPTRAVIDYVNTRLTAMWPDNVYDILPWLQALKDGSANDQADVDAGVSPRSTRWNGSAYDFLHPNATARAAMGNGPLKNLIISKGWTK